MTTMTLADYRHDMVAMGAYWRNPQRTGVLNGDAIFLAQVEGAYALYAASVGESRELSTSYLAFRDEVRRGYCDYLEREQQRRDGCQGMTRKGAKCSSTSYPYCHAHGGAK